MVKRFVFRDVKKEKMESKPYVKEIIVKYEMDQDPDLSYLEQNYIDEDDEEEREKYIKQDKNRLEQYYNNDWYMIGIYAKADLYQDHQENPTPYIQWVGELQSDGLWGIESDSDESYLKEIEENQIKDLKDVLKSLGIDSNVPIEIEKED